MSVRLGEVCTGEGIECIPLLSRKRASCQEYSWIARPNISNILAVRTSGKVVSGAALDLYSNNECEWAYPVTALPFSHVADMSMVSANFDGKVFACPIRRGTFESGFWYAYTAEKNTCVSVTVKSQSVILDPAVAVYNGTCQGDFACVAANDDEGPLVSDSAARFDAISGTTYYIFAFGAGERQGTIQVEIIVSWLFFVLSYRLNLRANLHVDSRLT